MSMFDETADFVVVGSGGGSMCAALVMRAAGRTVTILEKTGLVGGTTAWSGGVMWIPNNPIMKRDGVPDSLEQATAYMDAVVGDHNDTPGASRARRATFLSEGPRMVEFLLKQGIRLSRVTRWPDYYDKAPGASDAGRTVVADLFDANELGEWKHRLRPNFLNLPAPLEDVMKLPRFKKSWDARRAMARMALRTIGGKITRKHYVTAGAALQGRMLQASLKAGVDVRVDSPVSELIVENGAVTGVLTLKDGRPHRIGARLGVLVNAGGFSRNKEMRARYQPECAVERTSTIDGDTGEMIQEMMRHGAAVAQMEEYIGSQVSVPPGAEGAPLLPGAQALTAGPHAILVDQSGSRYLDECCTYTEYCKAMQARHKEVPAVPSWAIMDSRVLRDYMLAGTMPGSKKPERWSEEGFLHEGATIEALGTSLGMDPAALRATVDRFNGFVAANHDADFGRGDGAYGRWLGDPTHRPNETLGSIEEGPFYAIPVLPGDVGTAGGVVTDTAARVLREDGSIVPGLYATGVSTATVMGRVSPGSGVNIGPSMVWGFVAANAALQEARMAIAS